jgi:hypothetical protein
VQAAIAIAKGAVDTKMANNRANRSLQSQISSMNNSPSCMVSSPYINASIPSFKVGDDYLFNTYSIELHE